MTCSSSILRGAVLAAVLFGAAAVPAAAQAVRGTVADEASGAAVRGALVVLLDERGAQRAGGLTGERGEYAITAPAAGRYTLRVQRIGYADGVVPAVALAAGETATRDVQLRAQAIDLGGIVVEARRRCAVRPRDGLLVARLWDEARKALRAAAFTEAQQLYGYQFRGYRRTLDAGTLRVLRDSAQVRESIGLRGPYRSMPVESLLAHGFIQQVDGAEHYYAPDADALLSDAFLDAYCFRPVDAHLDDERVVGIAFEPVARRGPPAVRGTLWLDRESYELRWLEFTYVRPPSSFARDVRVGGRVEFEALPSGAWIVRRWWIRMPVSAMLRSAVSGAAELTALAEEGGEVLEVRAGAARRTLAAGATVEGVVHDAARGAPLAGALVYLSGTAYADTADERGRFRIERIPEGEYELAYTHPELRRLNLLPEVQPLSLRSGETETVALTLPQDARARAVAATCADDERHEPGRTGVLTGRVVDELSGAALPRAAVRVSWTSYRDAGATLVETAEAVSLAAGANGTFVVCGLPLDRTLRVQASQFGVTGAERTVAELGGVAFAEHELSVPLTRPVPVALHLRDWETGQPIRDAMVAVPGREVQALSDREGRVRIERLPPGPHTIEVRHVAYGTFTHPLVVEPGAADFEVRIPARALELEGLHVVVRSEAERVRRESGTRVAVLTRDQIEQLQGTARNVGDLARRLPGVRARDVFHPNSSILKEVCLESTRGHVTVHSTASVDCPGRVMVVLDGMPVFDPELLLSIPLTNLESVQFLNATEGALLYGTGAARGVLVLHTRGNGPFVRRDR